MNAGRPGKIAFSVAMIFVAFVLLVVTFVVSSLFVLDVSSKAADGLKVEAEHRAVNGLAKREIFDVAQRQSEVAWWDTSVEAITDGVDIGYFEDAMLDWFPFEYQIDRSALISPSGNVLLHALGESFVDGAQAESFAAQSVDLVQKAQANYTALRVGEDGEFWVEEDPLRGDTPLYAYDVRRIDGTIGILMAQAIIPDGDLTLPDGPAHVLVVYRPFTNARIESYASEIEIESLAFSNTRPKEGSLFVEFVSEFSDQRTYVTWESRLPSVGIRQESLPALASMLGVITFVMLLVTILYSRLVKRTRIAEARNRYLANHDALTDLANRNLFDDTLQDTINSGTLDSCAVLCIDLDKFKPVNDTFGHQTGDEVIRTIAQRIESVVGEHGMVARWWDEFIVLLHDATAKDEVMMLCDELIESVCEEIKFDSFEVYVGASVGVAWWPEDAITADMVIRSADQALYRAKALGRGRAVRADELPVDTAQAAAC